MSPGRLARRNEALIGMAGGASALETPALVLDLDRFDANMTTMSQHCARAGIGLRPHTKTHKSVQIARRQMAAGAVGLCCAKLGEAEALANGGLQKLLLTSPVVSARGLERLGQLNARIEELLVVVDHPANARALMASAEAAGKVQGVLLDLDPGLHRTGIPPGPEALALVRALHESPFLDFRGLQMYAGHLMHIADAGKRRDRSLATMAQLEAFAALLAEERIPVSILTGGGTGTFDIDPQAAVLTDLQAGSYLFMDRQYNAIEPTGKSHPFMTSLFVQTRVISCNHPGLATTDAGLKAFATDDEAPPIARGGPQGATYFFFGDEQGGLRWDSGEPIALGTVLAAVTPHCDPTVNLYDELHVLQGDTLVDIWPIEGRGQSA